MGKESLAAATGAGLAVGFDRGTCKFDKCSVRLEQKWPKIHGPE